MAGEVHRSRPQLCPRCGWTIDAHGEAGTTGAPKPRDLTVCCGCVGLLRFTESMELEAADLRELDAETIADLREAFRIARGIRALRRRSEA